MGQVLVRNLSDEVISALKVKAELKGHSLEQELREIIEAAAPFTPAEKLALSQEIRAMTIGGPHEPLSKDEIREGAL